MMNKEQVLLKKYQSINTETISDRIVEPFGFTQNYQTVMAYEPTSEKNKTYNIDRIGTVEYLEQKFQNEDKHQQQVMDVFGFAYSGKKYPVKLEISLKKYLLLKDQYPLITPFVKYVIGIDKYILEVELNDLRVMEQFMTT